MASVEEMISSMLELSEQELVGMAAAFGPAEEKRAALRGCIAAGQVELAAKLLEQQHELETATAEVNYPDDDGCTPVMLAARHGHVAMVAMLLAHGADADAQDRSGWSALSLAATAGHLECLGRLLRDGVTDVHMTDRLGRTALAEAAANGHWASLQLLLSHGGSHDRADHKGWAPLHHAAAANHPICALLLLLHGADAEAREGRGLSARALAVDDQPGAATGLSARLLALHAATPEVARPALLVDLRRSALPDTGPDGAATAAGASSFSEPALASPRGGASAWSAAPVEPRPMHRRLFQRLQQLTEDPKLLLGAAAARPPTPQPVAPVSAARGFNRSASRPPSTRRAPSEWRRRARADPIPPEAPRIMMACRAAGAAVFMAILPL